MPREEKPCPRCEAPQRFVPKQGASSKLPSGYMTQYVECYMCGWYKVLGITSKDIEDARTKLKKLRKRKMFEESKHGICSATLENKINYEQARMTRMKEELGRLVPHHGAESHGTAA